jgi:N-hydroxyarylamine O-acetyltransferase
MLAIDYEVANWYTSTFPQSRFMLNLIAAITADGQRRTLLNRELTTRWTDGRVEKRELKNRTDLLAALDEHFNLSFAPDTRFHRTDAPWPT